MKTSAELKELLYSINRKSYPAYKSVKGSYSFGHYTLHIDHVQGDPFASPSRLSVSVSGKQAAFPEALYDAPYKRIALQDFLTRTFSSKIEAYSFKAKGSGKSGLISVSRCGQEILERTACEITPANGTILLRFEVGFPANGRTIAANELIKILFDFLPDCVNSSLFYKKLNPSHVQNVADLAEDQNYIREQLKERNLIAFIANGSVLPRKSGVSQLPMRNSVPFVSTKSLEITLKLPHKGTLTGMGIPKGITLIVGGGYHGKSTLLKALELGVYNHIAGDGREYVITDSSAVKLRAEDGRSIKNTDISMFISNLPNKKDTSSFYTEDASGSTSQAANTIEAMETGASLFLIDEDTSATNFMIRDELMQKVVHPDQEPITPFINRVKSLYTDFGISSVIVAGSSGSYFHVADYILQMDHYVPYDITENAKKEALLFSSSEKFESTNKPDAPNFSRKPLANREFKSDSRIKIKSMGRDTISINRSSIDLRYLEQLADHEQTAALGYLLKYAEAHLFDGQKTIQTVVSELLSLIEKKGLAALFEGSYVSSDLALPRKEEIYGCLNRYRDLKL